jgi:hypothetical protein
MSTGMIDGAGPPGAVTSGAASPARRGRRWLAVAALAEGLVLVAAVITGLALGAHYQPVGLGNSGGHLGGRIITRQVDNFAPMTGQTYLPPQPPASGGLYVSLTNNGPLPVTIESASLNPPYAQGRVDRQAQPLRDTGPATYWPQSGFAPARVPGWPAWCCGRARSSWSGCRSPRPAAGCPHTATASSSPSGSKSGSGTGHT